MQADGTYVYDTNGSFEELAEGQTTTDTFTYELSDGAGGTATGTVTVTITGTNDGPVVQDVTEAADEDGVPVTGSFDGNDVDSDDDGTTLTYAITSSLTEGSVINNNDGTFTFDPGGDFQDLAAGQTRQLSFTYEATDGHGAVSNSGTVTLTISGTNDVPVIGGVATGGVAEDADPATLTTSGSLTITDTDNGESSFVAQASVAGTYGTFTLAVNGDWTYSADNTQSAIQSLAAGATLNDSFTATSFDGSASQTVTVTITGTNDVPVIGGVATGGVAEDADPTTLSTGGSLTITDTDNGESSFVAQASVAGTYGTFTLAANGDWTYSADNTQSAIQSLAAGATLNDSFTATSFDGSASQTVTVTITGTNDVPVIGTADNSGAVTELPNNDPGENSADRTDTGTITFTDVDLTDIHTVSVSDNGSGYRGALTAQVTTAATGGGTGEVTWTFTVNDADLDDLGPSDTLNQSYDVTVSDGNGGTKTETVTVTITGAADNTAPIADAQTLSADEDTPLNGTVTATDPDPDSQTYALVANSATNGSVTSFDANTGAFTFTPDADFSGVASFQFTAFDGSETSGPATVTIDVAPVADDPTLDAALAPEPIAGEFRVNSYTTADQSAPSVAALSDGGFVLIWMSDGQDGDRYGVYGQRYDELGAESWQYISRQYLHNITAIRSLGGCTDRQWFRRDVDVLRADREQRLRHLRSAL